MTVGMIGGKFNPIHNGHVYAIVKSACMVDELYVVLSHSKKRDKKLCQKSELKYIPSEIRLRWLSQIAKDMENVKIIAIEDDYDSDENYNWEEGANNIKKLINKNIDFVFSSENNYMPIFNKLYPSSKHIVIDSDRKKYPISSTKIREEGIYNNWEYIPDVVKAYFVKKVVVAGTESCGKSTLVKYLAKIYNTKYVSEFGRDVYNDFGGLDGGFTSDLYEHIVFGQKAKEFKLSQKANKILFIDTEATITNYYSKLYNQHNNKLIMEIAKFQEYDLVLYLEPDVKWVNDGTRQHGCENTRNNNNKELKKMLETVGIKYEAITGSYAERLEKSIKLVDDLFKNKKNTIKC